MTERKKEIWESPEYENVIAKWPPILQEKPVSMAEVYLFRKNVKYLKNQDIWKLFSEEMNWKNDSSLFLLAEKSDDYWTHIQRRNYRKTIIEINTYFQNKNITVNTEPQYVLDLLSQVRNLDQEELAFFLDKLSEIKN